MVLNEKKNRACAVILTVPFHDLDPLQMVWHGNYLKYFDIARSALFVQGGVDLFEYFKATNYIFPITKTSIKYISSLRYLNEFKSIATVVEAHYKIVIDFEKYIKDCACRKNIPVTGSLNPYPFNLNSSHFYDGMHLNEKGVDTVLGK